MPGTKTKSEADKINDKIFKILNKILENIKGLADLEPELHDILAFYFSVSLKLYETKKKGTQMDVDEQINFISELLGVSLRDIVERTINTRTTSTSGNTSQTEIPESPEQVKQIDDLTNLILNNASIVDLDDNEIDAYRQNVQKVLNDIKINI